MPKVIENVRETILTEAKELLINNTYDSFNIRELSSKCDLSIGTIYNYFPNKSTLITSIFLDDWNKALKRMENLNNKYESLKDKLYQVYFEMDTFLSDYLQIFMQMSSNSRSNGDPSCLHYLYPLLEEIIDFERRKGTISSPLPTEKLNKIIVNNLIFICTDRSISFEEVFSLINL